VEFDLRKFPIYVNGPDQDGLFDVAVPISRALISQLADGIGTEGHFIFMAAPPKFTRRKTPVAMFLVVDNSKLTKKAADNLFADFYKHAERKRCVPVPVTLDFERRTKLYDLRYVALRATDDDTAWPWNYMEQLILLYADDEVAAQQLFEEITT
jgi:hypothetical protein